MILCRSNLGYAMNGTNIFSGRIFCGECGERFGRKILGSYKSDKSYRKEIWQCNDKYKNDEKCGTHFVYEDEIKIRFIVAFNELTNDRTALIEDCRLVQSTLCDSIESDAKITAALLDRMIHHSHLLDFTSRSSRRFRDDLHSKNLNDDKL
ncbi:hypothetical protein FACS1894219_11180 [Clostridia bacterium]|nr:hypothetical protein FACS1894219_11180 [Clostridia bacterium]